VKEHWVNYIVKEFLETIEVSNTTINKEKINKDNDKVQQRQMQTT